MLLWRERSVIRFYDELNRLVAETSHSGNTSRLLYDSRSNVVQVSDAMGNVGTTSVSDLPGAGEHGLIPHTFVIGMSQYVNERGNTTRFTYDGVSRQLSKHEDLRIGGVGAGAVINAISVSTIWDANSRVSGRVDPTGNVTSYAYDHQNRQIRETFADGTSCRYGFNRNGTLAHKIDPRGATKEYTHDAIERKTDLAVSNLPLGQEQTTFSAWSYDGLSRVLKAEDNDTICEKTYDSLSREASDLQRIGTGAARTSKLGSLNSEINGKVSRTFDGVGNLKQLWYPQHHSAGTPTGTAIQRTHDAVDRLNTVSQGGSQIATFDHIGGGGRRLERTYTPSGGTNMMRTLTFDSERRFSAIDVTVGASRIVGYEYTWDRADNRRTEKRLAGAVDASTVGDFYVYDSAYRLVHADPDVAGASLPVANNVASVTPPTVNPATALDYHLDTSGNRTQVNDAGTIKPFVLNIGAPTHDSVLNQYSSIAGVLRAHDTAGNVTSQGTTERFFDCDNRLVQSRSGTKDVRYRYDVQGRRVSKADVAMGPAFDQVLYFYDDWQCVEETKANGGLEKTYVFGEGIDEILKATLPDAADLDGDLNVAESVDLYYHQNSLGSVTAVTDKDGNVAESYSYKPYGAVTIRNDSGTIVSATQVEQPFMFTGRRLDFEEESGLYFYRHRQYDPAAGRFLSRDPLGMWGDSGQRGSGQSYANSNPVNVLDPLGLRGRSLGEILGKGTKEWEEAGAFERLAAAAVSLPMWLGEKISGSDTGTMTRVPAPKPVARKEPQQEAPVGLLGGVAHEADAAYGAREIERTTADEEAAQSIAAVAEYTRYLMEVAGMYFMGAQCAGGFFLARMGAMRWRDIFWYSVGFSPGAPPVVTGSIPRGRNVGSTRTRTPAETAKAKANPGPKAKGHQEVSPVKNCFPAGTQVLTANGSRPIENVKSGDYVFATHPVTGYQGYFRVAATHESGSVSLIELRLSSYDGSTQEILCTPGHEIFRSSGSGDWLQARELSPGDLVLDKEGNPLTLLRSKVLAGSAKTYNLEIDDAHTYYVRARQSDRWVWVHNSSHRRLKDLRPIHTSKETGLSETTMRGLEKLSDAALLDLVKNPPRGEKVRVKTTDGGVMQGNHRVTELQRRAADPNNHNITPETEIPVDLHTPWQPPN